MGVGGGLGAAGILLLVLSFIALGVGAYYAYMCIQSRPRRKQSQHDPEHGPLISADPDVNGNHEDSLVASAPAPYNPKAKIDEPDSNDEKTVQQTKEENDLGVEKSETVLVPIETETEAITPTVEETSEAAVPVVVIPTESMPDYKDTPKVECPVTKSAESAPSAENVAAPRDCDLPVPIIMNAAFAVAKPITDSDEEDGLLLQKRLHHDDSLDPEPAPPLVPITHSIEESEKTSEPKEEPSTEDIDEPIPSAPPKESTPDAAPDTVLPTAPPKPVTPELPVTSDENAQPSAPPEEVTIESPASEEIKDSPIIDDIQPEDGVVYLETYKPTASEPIDSTGDDNIKEENSSTESSPEELAAACDLVAEVENKTEVTETEPVTEVESETVVIDPALIDKNSYGWSEVVVPTDPSSYGWSQDVKKVETELVKSSVESVDCDIGKCKPVITEEMPVSTENKEYIIDNEPKVKDEIIIIPPVVEESVVPSSHEASEQSVDTSNTSISSEEAVPPYTESAEPVTVVIPTDSSNYGWSYDADKVETDQIIIPPVVEEESMTTPSHEISVSTEKVSSPLEPELNEKSVDISNASISSEEAVPPYTVSAETVESTNKSLDQMDPSPEAVSVIIVPKNEISPAGEDEVDKVASQKDTESGIEASEAEPVAHIIAKFETYSDKEASIESTLNTEDIPTEASYDDKEAEVSTQVEDALEVTASSQDAETEIIPVAGESILESQVEEPIAQDKIAPLESLPDKIETENTEIIPVAGESILESQVEEPIVQDKIAPLESLPEKIEDAQTALAEQHNTDHSDTESSEPDVSEYSFSTGPGNESTAKVLEDEISSSLEPEVTMFRTLPISDDTAEGDSIASTVATAVTVTECDTDSASSISLSSDDEADDNSEGNKADSDSDISLSSDEENTSKVELDKGILNEVTTTVEETDTQKETAKEEKNEEANDTESDGTENPKEIKEEVVEGVQVVHEEEEKDEQENKEEEKEVVNHGIPQDSDTDDSNSDEDDDDKSTASSNSDDSEADKVPCVKKSKIPRLKSKQSMV